MNYTTSGEIARAFNHQPWTRQAACHGLTALFFSAVPSDIKRAKAICATCPVFAPCAAAAESEVIRDGGVWAGKTANKRRIERSTTVPVINHGTNAAYQQHIRYGIPVCAECRQARIDDRNARRARAAEFRNNGGHNLDWATEDVA